jgi:hypothetical protein
MPSRFAEDHRCARSFARKRAWVAIAAVLVVCFAPFVMARGMTCPHGGIAVSADSATDLDQACVAVKESVPFLTGIGLGLPTGVAIHIVPHLEGEIGEPRELARYDGHQCSIRLLAFAAAEAAVRQAGDQGLKVSMTPTLWRSIVVHELTHAAIHSACGQACPNQAAHEYIAAVAQLSVLPETVRGEILRSHGNLDGFADSGEISEIYYALGPAKFMVKSYLHYLRPGNGDAFIRNLLRPMTGWARPN